MSSTQREKHILEAPLLYFDLIEQVESLKAEKSSRSGARNSIALVKMPSLRIVLMLLPAGSDIPEHHAEGSINIFVVSGSVELATLNNTTILNATSLVCLGEGLPHSLRATKESVVLLTVIPKAESELELRPGAAVPSNPL